MKKIIQIALLGAALALGFTSCQKEYISSPIVEGGDQQNIFRGSFICYLDGGKFEADTKVTNIFVNPENGVKSLVIVATRFHPNKRTDSYERITITIPNYDSPRKYATPWDASIKYTNSLLGVVYEYSTKTPHDDYFVNITSLFKGNFASKLVSTDETTTIDLTGGTFDIAEQ